MSSALALMAVACASREAIDLTNSSNLGLEFDPADWMRPSRAAMVWPICVLPLVTSSCRDTRAGGSLTRAVGSTSLLQAGRTRADRDARKSLLRPRDRSEEAT